MGARKDLHKARLGNAVAKKPSKVFLKTLDAKGSAEFKGHISELKMVIEAEKSVKANRKVQKAIATLEGILK